MHVPASSILLDVSVTLMTLKGYVSRSGWLSCHMCMHLGADELPVFFEICSQQI